MTATNQLDSLWQWLYGLRREPMTVRDLMDELDGLRKGGVALPDLPRDGITMQQSLERLLIAGKATRDRDGGWLWAEPVKHEAQKGLFAT